MALKKVISVALLQLVDGQEIGALNDLVDKLKSKSFIEPVFSESYYSAGWVGFNEITDIELSQVPVERAEFLFFSLRIDTRKVPPMLLKKEYDLALKKEKENHPEKIISRHRKNEIKSNITASLLAKTQAVPKLINVVWDYSKNKLYVMSTSSKDIELVQQHFNATFKLETEEWMDEVGSISGSEFLKWIWYYGDCTNGQITQNRMIRGGTVIMMEDASSGAVSTKNKQDEAKYAMRRGLEIKNMAVEISSDEELFFWKFKLGTSLSRLQALKIPTSTVENKDEEDAVLYEQIAMIGEAYDLLFTAYEMANKQSPSLTAEYTSWLTE